MSHVTYVLVNDPSPSILLTSHFLPPSLPPSLNFFTLHLLPPLPIPPPLFPRLPSVSLPPPFSLSLFLVRHVSLPPTYSLALSLSLPLPLPPSLTFPDNVNSGARTVVKRILQLRDKSGLHFYSCVAACCSVLQRVAACCTLYHYTVRQLVLACHERRISDRQSMLIFVESWNRYPRK